MAAGIPRPADTHLCGPRGQSNPEVSIPLESPGWVLDSNNVHPDCEPVDLLTFDEYRIDKMYGGQVENGDSCSSNQLMKADLDMT